MFDRMKLVVLMLVLTLPLVAATSAEVKIRAVLDKQVEAWNRGDIPAFVTTYSDDCIFVGKTNQQGRAQVLSRYQQQYPTAEAMGHLTFQNLSMHMLESKVALLTADWHLDRTAAAGGPVGGYFSLVVHREHGEWKIAMDHTSRVP